MTSLRAESWSEGFGEPRREVSCQIVGSETPEFCQLNGRAEGS
jgi:hypothetical protein